MKKPGQFFMYPSRADKPRFNSLCLSYLTGRTPLRQGLIFSFSQFFYPLPLSPWQIPQEGPRGGQGRPRDEFPLFLWVLCIFSFNFL